MPGRVHFIAPCPGCGQDADWGALWVGTSHLRDEGYIDYTILHEADKECERTAA